MKEEAASKREHQQVLRDLEAVNEAAASLVGTVSDDDACLMRLLTIGQAAAGAAHEICNFLSPVLAYVQMAAANPEDSRLQRTAIDKARHGVEQASRLARSMLDSTTIDHANERSVVGDCIQKAIVCTANVRSGSSVDVALSCAGDLIARIAPGALQQIAMNLLSNALRAQARSAPSSGTVQPVLVDVTSREKSIVVTVKDHGTGIPVGIRETIFEPFVTAGHPTVLGDRQADHQADPRNEHQGHGLGLAISKELVEAAHGSIRVAATSSDGTTMELTVPAV